MKFSHPEKVICPACEREGKPSIVRNLASSGTILAGDAFWDENGQYHYHVLTMYDMYFGVAMVINGTKSLEIPVGAAGKDDIK